MEKTQHAKLNMYNAVISYFKENADTVKSLPALQISYTAFSNTVTSIAGVIKQKADVVSGVAKDKNKSRRALARKAATLASKIYAYANSIDNNKLKDRVTFTVSELIRLKNEDLPGVCKNILQAANENIGALAGYKVTPETNAAFSDSIAAYEALIPTPRNAVSKRATANLTLKELFTAADIILKKEMDKITEEYIDVNPAFYKTYVNNRVIVDLSTTSSQVKGVVTNTLTNEPVKDATITIADGDHTASTTAQGRYVIKQLVPGIYTITISKPGFKPETLTDIVVKLGQITKVDKGLLPVKE